MAEKLDPKDLVTIEELAISSMWEMVAQGPPGIATPTGTAHCDELDV